MKKLILAVALVGILGTLGGCLTWDMQENQEWLEDIRADLHATWVDARHIGWSRSAPDHE